VTVVRVIIVGGSLHLLCLFTSEIGIGKKKKQQQKMVMLTAYYVVVKNTVSSVARRVRLTRQSVANADVIIVWDGESGVGISTRLQS
jgi:hypothetical protein